MRHKSVPTPTIEIAILAKTLLNSGEYEPQWTTLSKTIKRALCVETHISFSQIHRESFYKELHKIWTDNKKERDRIQAVQVHLLEIENVPSSCIDIECAICIDTYKLDGKDKVTTLLCGHHFCTKCIFKHIQTRGMGASCPMCRSSMYEEQYHMPSSNEEMILQQMRADQKRHDRRHTRWVKRERARRAKQENVVHVS